MKKVLSVSILASFLVGCATSTTNYDNSAGVATVYEDTTRSSKVGGINAGINDLQSIADSVMRSLLNSPRIFRDTPNPIIGISPRDVKNMSTSRVNSAQLVDLFQTYLIQSSDGRIDVVSDEDIASVERFREERKAGLRSAGRTAKAKMFSGVDYQLKINIENTLLTNTSGLSANEMTFTFKLVDAGNGMMVWGDSKNFRKTAKDDVIYQ